MDEFKELIKWMFDAGMYLNVLALLPQPIEMIKSRSSKNVSVWMWLIFTVFQFSISMHGLLNVDSKPMFFGMGASAIVSFTTMMLCIIYRKNNGPDTAPAN